MKLRTVLGIVLIAVMSVACVKKGNNTQKPQPAEGKHYVKSIELYDENFEPYNESIEFRLDSKKRIISIEGIERTEGVTEFVYSSADFTYGNNNDLTIECDFDGEQITINCELNDRGAIAHAVYEGSAAEMAGVEENFTYNNDGELVIYDMVYMNYVLYSMEYEWKDGNIARIEVTSGGEYEGEIVCNYTDEPNPYNIDMFYSYSWTMPFLCEIILFNDGLLGNTNRSLLANTTDTTISDDCKTVLTHKFNSNGLLDYTIYEDTILKFICFE